RSDLRAGARDRTAPPQAPRDGGRARRVPSGAGRTGQQPEPDRRGKASAGAAKALRRDALSAEPESTAVVSAARHCALPTLPAGGHPLSAFDPKRRAPRPPPPRPLFDRPIDRPAPPTQLRARRPMPSPPQPSDEQSSDKQPR